jgi:uncharacterized protein Veg
MATYAFWLIASETGDGNIRAFANRLATEYAQRFAGWLGYVFKKRANLTQQTKVMKELEDALEQWVEFIPAMLEAGRETELADYVPKGAEKFFDIPTLNKIGRSVFNKIRNEYRTSSRTASDLDDLPIEFNPQLRLYEIPASKMTYPFRTQLRDLGFDYEGGYWRIDHLDSEVLKELPQAAKLERGSGKPMPSKPPREWFFEDWLPRNIDRFTKVFNEYGKARNVPYEFQFMLVGTEVNVRFARNIRDIDGAIAEIQARYGKGGDREGWMDAISSYRALLQASGAGALAVVDKVNDLQHSHGSMIEHFPDGVANWYPSFLDFKYSASPLHLSQAIGDTDLREMALHLLPSKFKERGPRTEHRTARGLAMEVAAQKGKAAKRKRLQQIKSTYPDMYDDVVKDLESRGLQLTASYSYAR